MQLYKKLVITTGMKAFCENEANRKECYSGCMTPREAVKWWLQEDSLKAGKFNVEMRYAILQYLLHDKNQSGVERTFATYKRNACPVRNRSDPKTILNEVQLRSFRKNSTLFEKLKEESISTEGGIEDSTFEEVKISKQKNQTECPKDRKLRNGYKTYEPLNHFI